MDRTRLISINNEIAVHAKRKELTPAMALFNDAVAEGIANSHTYAAIINANIRCGSLSGAESIVKDMVAHGRKKDVIICTTLMKGYCGEGLISKALALLEEMTTRKIEPNIRTINTILRGCVQIGDIDNAEVVITKATKDYKLTLDVSSWEYMIVLYCQGLRLDKALPIVGRLKDDPSMASGIANMHLNIARASALLGEWKTCRKALTATTSVLNSNNSADEEKSNEDDFTADQPAASESAASMKKTVLGGKRAWKSGPGAEEADEVDARRLQSLEMFREHSREEMLNEIRIIEEFVLRRMKESASALQYMFPYFLRIFSFSSDVSAVGSEIADGSSSGNSGNEKVLADMFHDIHNKFGLGPFVKKLTNQTIQTIIADSIKSAAVASTTEPAAVAASSAGSKKEKKGKQQEVKGPVAINTPDAAFAREQVETLQERLSQMINEKGKLNFGTIFGCASSSSSKKPLLKMEICSGAGEWAVAQAKEDSDNNWITLELRHDRVYQTLTKSLFSGASNMCILGGDAMRILPDRIESSSLDYLFVNHPEPPQQTGGLDSQGKHLLTNDFFLEANRILKKGGTFTIVTDNQWYGKFLMRQLGALINSSESQSQKQSKSKDAGFQLRSLARSDVGASDEWTVHDSIPEGRVFLFVGRPGPHAGHVVDASSYFDRLWKKSKIMERYFIVLKKDSGDSSNVSASATSAGAGKGSLHTSPSVGGSNHKSGKDFKHKKPEGGFKSGGSGGGSFKGDGKHRPHSAGSKGKPFKNTDRRLN